MSHAFLECRDRPAIFGEGHLPLQGSLRADLTQRPQSQNVSPMIEARSSVWRSNSEILPRRALTASSTEMGRSPSSRRPRSVTASSVSMNKPDSCSERTSSISALGLPPVLWRSAETRGSGAHEIRQQHGEHSPISSAPSAERDFAHSPAADMLAIRQCILRASDDDREPGFDLRDLPENPTTSASA